MKKILSIFLSAVIIFALIPIENAMAYATGDDYPSEYKNVENNSIVDRWNFYNRQCTSFVAWCLNSRNGVNFTNQYGGIARWGNAKEWYQAAQNLGIAVDNNPAVGSVAVWTSGKYGHVAWVKGVTGDLVTIEEYNWSVKGGYGQRTISKSEVNGFIHIKDIISNTDVPDPDPIVPPSDIVVESNIVGHLDKISVTFNKVYVEGWATCRNHPSSSMPIHIHIDEHIEGFPTSGHRPDADAHVEALWGIPSADGLHGFANTVSTGNQFGKNATISVWGVCDGCSSACLWVGQVYLPRGYTVAYNANGGSGAPATETKTENVDLILSTTIPKRANYSFIGWSDSPASTAAKYMAGEKYASNSAITLYAVWKKNTYTVTYDANGGESVSTEYISVSHGNSANLSQTAYRAGYQFCGWNTNPNATNALSELTISQNTVVYAIWELIEVNVEKVELNKPSIELKVGMSEELVATIIPSNETGKTIIWTSSNEAVATVENGIVTARSAGDTLITAMVDGISAECTVTVTEPVAESEKIQLRVGSAAGIKGQTVTIPITINENFGIAGFKVNIQYDAGVLNPISIEKGEAISQHGTLITNINQPQENVQTPMHVTALWTNPSDITENGNLLLVTFKILENAEEGTYPVSVTYKQGDVTNQVYEDVEINVVNGVVSVINVLKGDVYVDNLLSTKDLLKLGQYLANWPIDFTAYEKDAADIHVDGLINTKDSIKLSQSLLDETEMIQLMESNDAGSITLEAGNSEIVNDFVDIPVTMVENVGVAGMKIKLSYDNTILTPVSITRGEALMGNGVMICNLDQECDFSTLEEVTIFWANSTNIMNTGVACTVRFKVRDDIEDDIVIKLSCEEGDICDQYCSDLEVTLRNGKVITQNIKQDYTVKSISGDFANGSIYVEAELVKNTDRKNKDTFIIALYEDDVMVDMAYIKAEFEEDCSFSFGGILKGAENATLKAFVLDSLSGMQSLSNVIEKTVK